MPFTTLLVQEKRVYSFETPHSISLHDVTFSRVHISKGVQKSGHAITVMANTVPAALVFYPVTLRVPYLYIKLLEGPDLNAYTGY